MDRVSSIEEWVRLPEISVPLVQSERDTGSVVTVAKVGFLAVNSADCQKAGIAADASLGKCILPTVVVGAGSQRQLYRLTVELGVWAFECVALAQEGRLRFPCEVEFGRLDGRAYAEFVGVRSGLN